MEQAKIFSMKVDKSFIARFLRKLALTKKGAPDLKESTDSRIPDIFDVWLEVLWVYTASEIVKAYKIIADEFVFFPTEPEVVDLINGFKFGTIEARFDELILILADFEQKRTQSLMNGVGPKNRTCDEILARIIDHLGGLNLILRKWGSANLEKHKPVFAKAYKSVIRSYLYGEFDGKCLPKVGFSDAVPIGTPDALLLPPAFVPGPTHSEKKAQSASDRTRSLINEFKEWGRPEPEPVPTERLNFATRVHRVAYEQGYIASQEVPENFRPNNLSRELQKALAWCHKNNEKLNSFSIFNPSKGWFSKDLMIADYFFPEQDPLFDEPRGAARPDNGGF